MNLALNVAVYGYADMLIIKTLQHNGCNLQSVHTEVALGMMVENGDLHAVLLYELRFCQAREIQRLLNKKGFGGALLSVFAEDENFDHLRKQLLSLHAATNVAAKNPRTN
jgi:hypothetical protein